MTSHTRNQRGASLLEITIVVCIALVLTATAAPNMMNAIGNARLRGASSSLASLMQNGRAAAVKLNRIQTTRFVTLNGGPYAYVKDATASDTSLNSTDVQVQLGAPIIQVSTPTGGNPTAMDSSTLGFTPSTYPTLASFNPYGMPCVYQSGLCISSGFVYYFTDVRRNAAWTAVSISPAGRIQQWFWYGDHWGA